MRKGFTLIELLIVVAIIAILAAIAVPNFLEAQTRSRVSRVHNDLRTVALAMESYMIDNNSYPPSGYDSCVRYYPVVQMIPDHLTTPIAYTNQVPYDIFRSIAGRPQTDFPMYVTNYSIDPSPKTRRYPHNAYMTSSFGPDLIGNISGYRSLPRIIRNEELGPQGGYGVDPVTNVPIGVAGSAHGLRYDPTNGTISWGDIYRHEGMAKTAEN